MSNLVDLTNIKKVLIIRLDKVGDLIVSTPAILGIRESLPAAEITLLTGPYTNKLLLGWQVLDAIICYDKAWGWHKKRQFIRQLRVAKYDLVVVMTSKMVAYYLAWLSGARLRLGKSYTRRLTAALLTPFLLTHQLRFPLEENIKHKRPVPHEAQQLLRLNALIGLESHERPFAVPLPKDDMELAWQLLNKHFSNDKIIIGLHLSAMWVNEGWNGSDIAALLQDILMENPQFVLLLTCGPADKRTVNALLEKLQVAEEITHDRDFGQKEFILPLLAGRALLSGNLSFQRWTALLAQCRLIISPDTGALHLSSALRKPIIALYSPRLFELNSQQWYPWKVPHRIVKFSEYGNISPAIMAAINTLLSEHDLKD